MPQVVIQNTGTQILRGEFDFGSQDFENQSIKYRSITNATNWSQQCSPCWRINVNGAERYLEASKLIEQRVVSDLNDNHGLSVDLPLLRQQMESGAILEVPGAEIASVSLNQARLTNLSRQWLPIPLCAVNAMTGQTRLLSGLVGMLWFEVDGDSLDFVIAVNTDALNDVAPGEDVTIGNMSIMVDDMLTAWSSYLQTGYIDADADNEDLMAQVANVGAKWDANFRVFLKWFKQKAGFAIRPKPLAGNGVSVNAYIDFGNDSTSVILREELNGEDPGNEFAKIQLLELFNFSKPLELWKRPFSTNVAFRDGRFARPDAQGTFGTGTVPKWLSPAAIGAEASDLLKEEGLRNAADPQNVGCISPKRFLWDDSLSESKWVFANSHLPTAIPLHAAGVTDRMTDRGWYVAPGQEVPGQLLNPIESRFSKRSLTTFVFLEIFVQLHRQINGVEFRQSHGSETSPRLLRNVIVSCPTGMSKVEQVALRKCAEQALSMCIENLTIYSSLFYTLPDQLPTVKPSSKELSIPNDEIADRQEWGYDEATLGQFVWLYSEMIHKRSTNCSLFKRDFGLGDNIRIASIDIGAGTTDVMICDHELSEEQEIIGVKPKPVFWDSMPLAGHDLLECLVRKLILTGVGDSEQGMLLELMTNADVANATDKITQVFGQNHANQTVADQAKRQHLLQNIVTPLAFALLEHANIGQDIDLECKDLVGEEFFDDNVELIRYVHNRLGVDLTSLRWVCSAQRVNKLVVEFFEEQLSVVSHVFHEAKPTVVLLAGGVFKSRALTRLMCQKSGLPRARILNLNSYDVGSWFPFVDHRTGILNHGKSVVSIGMALADLAERGRLRGMGLVNDALITSIRNDKLFVSFRTGAGQEQQVMADDEDRATLEVSQLPLRLLSTPIRSSAYPRRNAYKLDFNVEGIRESLAQVNQDMNTIEMNQLVQRRKDDCLRAAPIAFQFERGEDNREEIIVVEAESDNEEFNIQAQFFKVFFESMPEGMFWMERGLKI